MAKPTRRNHSPAFKAKVALAAIRGDRPLSQWAEQFAVQTNQIQDWKQQLVVKAKDLFGAGMAAAADHEQVQQELHAKIGQLTMKKNSLATTLGTGRWLSAKLWARPDQESQWNYCQFWCLSWWLRGERMNHGFFDAICKMNSLDPFSQLLESSETYALPLSGIYLLRHFPYVNLIHAAFLILGNWILLFTVPQNFIWQPSEIHHENIHRIPPTH